MGVRVDSEDKYHSCSQSQDIQRLAGRACLGSGCWMQVELRCLQGQTLNMYTLWHYTVMRAAKINLPT
jgi:hypothetical protein